MAKILQFEVWTSGNELVAQLKHDKCQGKNYCEIENEPKKKNKEKA